MPQDSLRSVVLRSFVTCDDPKGVVECGTIRKSKSHSKKLEEEVQRPSMMKNLNPSSSYREEKNMNFNRSAEELHSPSSSQLMEVSRGAHKLNRVIDLWSKRMSFDGQSKDIAKELLRGALDLQDSLIMLGKLQEASEYVAKFKRTHKERALGARAGNLGPDRTVSERFEDRNYSMEFHNPRLSYDGSSRDCLELREVIRDSLARQNLLPDSSFEQKNHFVNGKLDLSPDIPSTSSSQSTVVNLDFTSSISSSSLKVPQGKPKGPNLIAKLMGLEEIPSKPLQSPPHKSLSREKIVHQRKPIFDIDLPRAMKPQYVTQKVNQEKRTLEDIIETMRCKGFLKSSKHHCHPHSYEKRFTDGSPHIVVIKPLPKQGLKETALSTHNFIPEEVDINHGAKHRNRKTKEEVSPKAINHLEQPINLEMYRNVQVKKIPGKRLGQEKVGKDCKKMPAKPEQKEANTNVKLPSVKIKASVPKLQRNEAVQRKAEKIQKPTPTRMKPVELENTKSKSVSFSHDQSKASLTKLRKPENISYISNDPSSQHKRRATRPVSKGAAPTMSRKSMHQKRNVMNEKKNSGPIVTDVEDAEIKDHDVRTDLFSNNDFSTTIANNAVEMELPTEKTIDICEILSEDNYENSHNYDMEATVLPTQPEGGTRPTEEATDCQSQPITEAEFHESLRGPTVFLLRNPLFLSRVEELFDTDAQCVALALHENSLQDHETSSNRLLLDCANELLELRSLQSIPAICPLLHKPACNSRTSINLCKLVVEVCDGIENLKNYYKISCERSPANCVHAVLEKDIWCKEMVSGTWNMGWRHGYGLDEVEQVVVDVEELITSGLIEEVLAGFVLRQFV